MIKSLICRNHHHHHHHHQKALTVWISLTLSPSVPNIHRSLPVLQTTSYSSANIDTSTCRRAIEKRFLSSFLLLQQCLACLLHHAWMVCEMGGKWPYIRCFVEGCFKDLFLTAFLRSSHLDSFPCVLLASMWCIHIVVSI